MSKINKQQLALEFFSVVFAVIFALVLNSWRESMVMKKKMNRVIETIQHEAQLNDSLIRLSHDYRGKLLQGLYNNTHELFSIPVEGFPVNVNDNDALAKFFKNSLLFGVKDYYEQVLILNQDSNRVLILDNKVFELSIKKDTLRLLGVGNIKLKTPELRNLSFELAQATGTLVSMDIALVEKLSRVNSLIIRYLSSSENALVTMYSDNHKYIIPSIEDMYDLEADLMEANAALLEELQP